MNQRNFAAKINGSSDSNANQAKKSGNSLDHLDKCLDIVCTNEWSPET